MSSNSSSGKEKLFQFNKQPSIKELKIYYEPPSFNASATATMLIKQKSPKCNKKAIKSKVKQMASMFNSKIAQIVRRDANGIKYCKFVNDFSMEHKQTPKAIFARPLAVAETQQAQPKIPAERDFPKSSVCFIPENAFAKLTVKEKAQLYTQFVEEMTKRNHKFNLLKCQSNSLGKESEVKVEKQISVKNLLLEFNGLFSKTSDDEAKAAVQRIDGVQKDCAARKMVQNAEFKNIFEKKFTKDTEEVISPIKPPDNELHQTADSMFENLQIENLFFSWYKEQHDSAILNNNKSNESEMDEEKQKSAIERLLAEAIAKLEITENEKNTDIPIAMPRKRKINSPASCCNKFLENEESESGLSSMPKNTSGSQPETHEQQTEKSEIDVDINKFLRSSRKKKLRRNIFAKKEDPQQEVKQITSTDSDSDGKRAEAKLKNTKSLIIQAIPEKDAAMPVAAEQGPRLEYLMKTVNSPNKIKSAYTLTINDLDPTPGCTPRTSINGDAWKLDFGDSYATDQGFETANDSPLKKAAENMSTLNYTKDNFNFSLASDNREQEAFKTALDLSFENSSSSMPKTSIGFSTPIQSQEQHAFMSKISAKRLFSPVTGPPKGRRKSIYDIELRRSSLAMQVIKEDQPLDTSPPTTQANSIKETKAATSANTPKEMKPQQATKTSQFWLKCGDYSMVFDIDYIEPLRLRTLYKIFSQTSCSTRDLHFGIDNNKFPVNGPLDSVNCISSRIPESKDCSHYWFSTGELTLPFNGKYLLPHKIQNLFHFIKTTTEETGILRFGVDAFEFSDVPEFWHQSPKFSMDDQYSMLVGLQSGDSNGLEGRSSSGWPHTKPVSATDSDQYDNEDDNYQCRESGRLFYSPFGSNHTDLSGLSNHELNKPRNSLAMLNLESFCGKYENEPLDQLFDGDNRKQRQLQSLQQPAGSKQIQHKHQDPPSEPLTVPDMINALEDEKRRFSHIQLPLANPINPTYVPKNSLDEYKNIRDYVEKLKPIITNIGKVGGSDNFKVCSVDQLDSYMHFLNRYAEVCFHTYKYEMDTVLDALAEYKPVIV